MVRGNGEKKKIELAVPETASGTIKTGAIENDSKTP